MDLDKFKARYGKQCPLFTVTGNIFRFHNLFGQSVVIQGGFGLFRNTRYYLTSEEDAFELLDLAIKGGLGRQVDLVWRRADDVRVYGL